MVRNDIVMMMMMMMLMMMMIYTYLYIYIYIYIYIYKIQHDITVQLQASQIGAAGFRNRYIIEISEVQWC